MSGHSQGAVLMGKGGIADKDDGSFLGELRRRSGRVPPNKVCSVAWFAQQTASASDFTCDGPANGGCCVALRLAGVEGGRGGRGGVGWPTSLRGRWAAQ